MREPYIGLALDKLRSIKLLKLCAGDTITTQITNRVQKFQRVVFTTHLSPPQHLCSQSLLRAVQLLHGDEWPYFRDREFEKEELRVKK